MNKACSGIWLLSVAGAISPVTAFAVTESNVFVTVSSSTAGVEGIFPVGGDFYVTTRGVTNPPFRADIGISANSPYYLVKPSSGRMNLTIGEYGEYRVRDESGAEDSFTGRVYVVKIEIEPKETNVCWKASSCKLKLTDDSVPGGVAVWTSNPAGISGSGNSITFNPSALSAGEYTVTVKSSIVPSYTDTCIVRIIKPVITTPNEGDVRLFGEEIKFAGAVEPAGLADVQFAWNVEQGGCNPMSSSTQDFQTTLGSVGDVKVLLKVTIGNLTCSTNRVIQVVRPEVTQLSWNNDHALRQGFTGSNVIDDPVWIKQYNGAVIKNEPGAYTRNNVAIAELSLSANLPLTSSVRVQVKGTGNIENFYSTDAVFSRWQWNAGELTLSSSPLYASVNFYDKLCVTWAYRARNLSNGWGAWINMNQTSNILYVTFADPVAPEASPHVGILDFACRWAANANTEGSVVDKLLSNGFQSHYSWNFDCNELSSDFVRMVSSIGVQGKLHKWASKFDSIDVRAAPGDMVYQRTKSINPVGGLHTGVIEWSWHQWAEAASKQCDPSAAVSISGDWRVYEDYLFTHYQEVVKPLAQLRWVVNNPGQSVGCEHFPDKCTYETPTATVWRGPDR